LIQPESAYKRIIRFFNHRKRAILTEGLGLWIGSLASILPFKTLTLDRTNWKLGSKDVNLLVLAIQWGGWALPIAWLSLDKAGNSSQSERMRFFQNALQRFDLRGKTLLADREFIGEEWFNFLTQSGLHFIIRLRQPCYKRQIAWASGQSYDDFFAQLTSQNKFLTCQIELEGQLYTLTARRNPDPKAEREDRILIFLSTWPPQEAVAICQTYRLRWKIECCFKHLKTNGFNLEDLNLKCDEKIELLFGLTAACYALALLHGEIEQIKNPTKLKNYPKSKKTWPEISTFRRGLISFERNIDSVQRFLEKLIEIVSFLSNYFYRKSVQ
jgi:hypothetical protein